MGLVSTARIGFLFLCYLIISVKSYSQEKIYTTNRTTIAPTIDGVFSDEAWNNVSWGDEFVMYYPQSGANPTFQTQFKILYDDNNLYVALKMLDDEPGKIERRLSRRDQRQGDWIMIGFDSYNDNLTAYKFGVNAAGVKYDLITINDNKDDRTWDGIYNVKVSIDDEGWNAEFKIPLSQLRFANIENHEWGMQIQRKIFRFDERSTWQHIPRDAGGWVSNWGSLYGIKGIKPKLDIELVPYTVVKSENYKAEEGNPYADGTDNSISAGMDGKVSISNDFTLNFTINPDFGQVEADPSEVNLSAFETFFEEKRPFFIEGKNIFSFPISAGGGFHRENLFYSRRIGRRPHLNKYDLGLDDYYADMPENANILAAFKLSGKTRKGLSVGILESITPETKADFSNSDGKSFESAVEPFTNFFLARVIQDFNNGNTSLGGAISATNRSNNSDEFKILPDGEYSGGLDFQHYWKDQNYMIKAVGFFSHVVGDNQAILNLQESSSRYYQRPDVDYLKIDSTLTSLSGLGGGFRFAKVGGGNWRYSTSINFRSPGFENNGLGYIRNTDEIQINSFISYRLLEPKGIFKSLSMSIRNNNSWDYHMNHNSSGLGLNFNSNLKCFWRVFSGFNFHSEYRNRFALRGGPALIFAPSYSGRIGFESDDRKNLVFELRLSGEKGKYDTRLRKSINVGVDFRASTALSFSIDNSYTVGENSFQYIQTYEQKGKDEYLLGTIKNTQFRISARVNYSLTPDLTVQYYAQPFIYAGKYSNFKRVTNSTADNYFDRFHEFGKGEIFLNGAMDEYIIKENGESHTFNNPDFNRFAFNSNLVVRWEYSPGSTLYLVWSQGRSGGRYANDYSGFDLYDDFNSIFNYHPTNVFLIKFSYRFVI